MMRNNNPRKYAVNKISNHCKSITRKDRSSRRHGLAISRLKPDAYKILVNCIEVGINSGYRKAHKHTDNPSEELIKQEIEHYIMLEVSEKFKFD